jgi:hypothetical protein
LKIADTFGYDPPSHVTAFQRLLSAFGFFSSMLGTVASILAPEVAPELETAFAVGSKLAGGLSSTFGAINTQIGFHSSQMLVNSKLLKGTKLIYLIVSLGPMLKCSAIL